jgi:glycosyltransferase involved in cell wall biosynthesis
MNKVLSILIPCFNEEETVGELIQRVLSGPTPGFTKEIIFINDGSTDRSENMAQEFRDEILILSHKKNLGKGSAIRSGLMVATGEYVLIQDADLEYAPEDYSLLLEPVMNNGAQAVYGVRQFRFPIWQAYINVYYWGARFLNLLMNALYRVNLNDIHVGHKLFRRDLLSSGDLKEDGFSFCHELTCLLLENNVVPHQVPITYSPRGLAEGKKIRAKDGMKAIWYVLNRRMRSILCYNKIS